MSLNSIMYTSLSGMFYSRAAIETASHNIANANTPGYSRQQVTVSAAEALRRTYGVLGSGVRIDGVRRLTDQMLIRQLQDQSARLAGYEQVDVALSEIEAVFGSVENNHLGTALNDFFAAWSDLSTSPEQGSLRQVVVDKAGLLATDFRNIIRSLDDLERDLDAKLQQGVSTLNELLSAVGDLNERVLVAESQAGVANDLRDQRDALLAEISQLAHVQVSERDDGTVDVSLGGRTLVTRGHVVALSVGTDPSTGETSVTTADGRFGVELTEGALAGIVAARDGQVVRAREQLDAVAAEVIARVNELHAEGVTPGGRGLLFFSGDGAADISVNAALVEDADLVAASRSGLSGDNDLAMAIAALANEGGADGRGLVALYDDLVVDIASSSAGSRFQVESQSQLVEAVATRLESLRGVSLDEEAAEMIRYQNSYDASARVVAAVQEMFDTLLEMI